MNTYKLLSSHYMDSFLFSLIIIFVTGVIGAFIKAPKRSLSYNFQ